MRDERKLMDLVIDRQVQAHKNGEKAISYQEALE